MKTRLSLAAAAMMLTAAHGAQAGTAAGTQISNQATATYLDAALGSHNAASNTVITTVQQVAALTVGAGATKTAAAGSQVVYAQSVTNTGNGSDTFALSSTNSGQFSMTGVVFYADANGDGVADNATAITSTGPLAAGAVFKYVAVATMPGSATAGNTNSIVVTATSGFNGAVSATATDVTTVGAAATVDMTLNSMGAGAPGVGAGVEAGAVATNTTSGGVVTRYKIYLSNAGGSPDTFNLSASTDPTFGALTLPSGWTVVYRDASNQVITAATVAAGGNVQVWADVTPPAGSPAATTDLYFRAMSPTTNVTDRMHVAVTVASGSILVNLSKTQALDANCDGVADTAFSATPITIGAVPGACIRYQITATNAGTAVVNTVVISDVVPVNTTYHATVSAAVTQGLFTAPLANTTGTVTGAIGTLIVGQSESLTFGVRINP